MICRLLIPLLLLLLPLPLAAKATLERAATPALWEVASPKGNKLYLLGTFHLLPKNINWQSKLIENKIKRSKKLVLELTAAEMQNPAAQGLLLQKGLLPPGESLDQQIGPELFAKVEAAGQSVGVPVAALKPMRPWMASVILATQSAKAAGFEAGLGVEAVLQAHADKSGIGVVGLETMAEQVAALASLEDDGARQMLEETASQLANARTLFARMVNAWASGDPAQLEAVFLDDMESYPKAYDALLRQRNLRWLPKLEALLADKPVEFVAVGAGHLVGPDGMVALLKAKGYRVIRMQPGK